MSLYETKAVGKRSADGKFEKMVVSRAGTGDMDVDFDIKFCGLCHTDLLVSEGSFGATDYPCIPGHEIAGVVTKIGSGVTDLEVGDHVGVGYYVDSCLDCNACNKVEENVCEKGNTPVFAGQIKYGRVATDNQKYTYGGFSDKMTTHRRFLYKIPKSYSLQLAGPVFCSGITMYSPLKRFGATKGGLNVGILGLGGLGQMGIRLAAAMGNRVTAISTNWKKQDTARALGANHFVVSTEPDSMAEAARSLDLVLNTISANHQIAHYFPLMKQKGTIVLLGAVLEPQQIPQVALLLSGICITGSCVGGTEETQECIDFFAKKDIRFNTKLLTSPEEIDEAAANLHKGMDSIVRYVVDIEKVVN